MTICYVQKQLIEALLVLVRKGTMIIKSGASLTRYSSYRVRLPHCLIVEKSVLKEFFVVMKNCKIRITSTVIRVFTNCTMTKREWCIKRQCGENVSLIKSIYVFQCSTKLKYSFVNCFLKENLGNFPTTSQSQTLYKWDNDFHIRNEFKRISSTNRQ